jgi:nucleoside-diphosphate-sugar epimerase
MSRPKALIVGVTGIVGNNLARHLLSTGEWDVVGVSRRAPKGMSQVQAVTVDLQDRAATQQSLQDVSATHVFYCTWTRQQTETENIRVNGAMITNLLDAVIASGRVQHVALVTGLKHYLGPFEMYAKSKPVTPFRETQPRLDVANFYYTQEDILYACAERQGFTWSVHRPHTIVGYAVGNAMNLGVTLAVYASICKATGRAFVFPGSSAQYNGLTDMTDAGILAKHLTWAATTSIASNEAFNIVNGDVFRWEQMWKVIADYFGLEFVPYSGEPTPLEKQMADAAPLWDQIVQQQQLQPNPLHQLVSPWHTDADLGRPMECITEMSKSRQFGFKDYQQTEQSFIALFDQLRQERIIP